MPVTPGLSFGFDWLAHYLEFLVVMTWFGGVVKREWHLYVAAGLIALGVFVEVLQAASIFRHFDLKDIVSNIAGVLTGLLLVRTVMRDWCQRVEARLKGTSKYP